MYTRRLQQIIQKRIAFEKAYDFSHPRKILPVFPVHHVFWIQTSPRSTFQTYPHESFIQVPALWLVVLEKENPSQTWKNSREKKAKVDQKDSKDSKEKGIKKVISRKERKRGESRNIWERRWELGWDSVSLFGRRVFISL